MQCTKCMEFKNEEDFPWKSKASGKRSRWCKLCHRDVTKQNYERNKQYRWEYLNTHPCVDCGESDRLVLEFDHIKMRMGANTFVTRMGSTSLENLQKEIDQCEVRCANCHTRRTRLQMDDLRDAIFLADRG
jgi:hypothetical protein